MANKTAVLLGLAAAIFANTSLAFAGRSPVADSSYATRGEVSNTNYLDLRQFRLEDARVPGTSARQSVTAWQVNAGSWNGQSLDGISVVLIETNLSQEGSRQLACYVSEYATPAQREALLAAMRSTQANLRDANIRLEPAVIRIENTGDSAVIHLALVA
jgi:hypothetical protein